MGYTSGDVYYNAGAANVPGFAQAYNSIVDSVQSAMKIPSFTSKNDTSAPTITLTGDETVVTDSNGVLSNFRFTDGGGASFRKSGNSLYITQTGNISDSTVFSCSRDLPSAEDSSVSIWYGGTSKYQACVSLYSPSTGSLNAYFKLKAPAKGNIALTKTTEDGKNLEGWRLGIYADDACTSLVSGFHATDSSGKISVTDLPAGTYYVKELGHSDSKINALYTCASTNPQKVTVTSGGTAAVKFHNKLNKGDIRIAKSTNTGKNLNGWQVGIYTDASCTKAITGAPFTTGADGVVTAKGLLPGTYYAKEVASRDLYWVCDSDVKTVKVAANQTAVVTFSNTHRGRCKLIKTMPDGGSAAGWKLEVASSDGKVVGTYITGKDGTVLTDYLLPGKYTVKELLPEDSPYRCESANPQTVTIQAGQTAEITFTNRLKPGEILVKKVDTKGNPLVGAEFLLEWSADGTSWKPVVFTDASHVAEGTCTTSGLTDGKLTSGEDGLLRFIGLHPLRQYRLTETKAPEGYQLLAEPAFERSIPAENDFVVQLTVVNAPTYELPKTGSTGSTVLRIAQMAAAALLALLICHIKKRR